MQEQEEIGLNAEPMISPQFQYFVKKHEEMIQAVDRAVGGYNLEAYKDADSMIYRALKGHFRNEEEILYPIFSAYGQMVISLIDMMRGEHKEIYLLHQKFREVWGSVEKGSASQEDAVYVFELLRDKVRTHEAKEDNVLLTMASRLMSEEDKDKVAQGVQLEN